MLVRLNQSKQGIKTSAKPDFQNIIYCYVVEHSRIYKPGLYKNMHGFLYRPMNGMIGNIHFGYRNAGRAIFSYNYLSFHCDRVTVLNRGTDNTSYQN